MSPRRPQLSDMLDPEVSVIFPQIMRHNMCCGFVKHGGGVRCKLPATVFYLDWYDGSRWYVSVNGFCGACDPKVGAPVTLDEVEVVLVMKL